MVWKLTDPQGNESAKCRWETVQYTRGRGLDLGCGPLKQFPHWIGIDNRVDAHLYNIQINPDVTVETAEKLDMFASGSMDFCFSSHLLEHIDIERVPAMLKEWWRVLKPKGHLVLYLPAKGLYPDVGEVGCNPDHKFTPTQDMIIEWMKTVGSWDLVENQLRGVAGDQYPTEYSFLQVYKKF